MLSTIAMQSALPVAGRRDPHDRSHQLCRRPRHGARAMGGRGRHAGGHPDGLHSGISARDLSGRRSTEMLFAGGGVAYIVIALLATVFTDRQRPPDGRERNDPRILDLLARRRGRLRPRPGSRGGLWRRYPPAVGAFRPIAIGARAFARARGKQWASACGSRPRSAFCSDALDALIAAQCDVELIRKTPEAAAVLARIGDALRVGSLDLRHLSLELLTTGHPTLPPDHQLAIDALNRETARVEAGAMDPEARAALDAVDLAARSLAQSRPAPGESACRMMRRRRAAIGDVDLAAFIPKRNYGPSALTPHLSPDSPVLRFAARLSLAMMAGAVGRPIAWRRAARQLGFAHHRRRDPSGPRPHSAAAR